ncbi:MAG: transposase [Deltaproteobacteria bacterium]|nr:transposase [Deltaproteobacteria bacterium]
MISHDMKQAILTLHQKKSKIREISRILKISRNTVRRVLRGQAKQKTTSKYQEATAHIKEVFQLCRGNVVRVREVLKERNDIDISYSTLTRLVREMDIRENKRKRRSGTYNFDPGVEMQHDTSPHVVVVGGRKLTAQCASLVLSYSRRLFIQYYPGFTRFEARVFLNKAFGFMGGACTRCIIDNTSVIVACGSGPDAEIAPDMKVFGNMFGMDFVPHHIGDADRKAKVERNFSFIEGNFLAGRTFSDWHDFNRQARKWCEDVANHKPKRSLGMSPDEAFLMEKAYITPLPVYIPPVYQAVTRIVDVESYVSLDTNKYSVPERLIGKEVEVQKHWDLVVVYFGHEKVAEHKRPIGQKNKRVTDPRHLQRIVRRLAHRGPSKEEKQLKGIHKDLDLYIAELKKRSKGRGIRQFRRLIEMKRSYPQESFLPVISRALRYGLYDLNRLEQMILFHLAGDFFGIDEGS